MGPLVLALLLRTAPADAARPAPADPPPEQQAEPEEPPAEETPDPQRPRLKTMPSQYSSFGAAGTKAGYKAPAPAQKPKPAPEPEVKVPLTPFFWPGKPGRAEPEPKKEAPVEAPKKKVFAPISIVANPMVKSRDGDVLCDMGAWQYADDVNCFTSEAACAAYHKNPCRYVPARIPVAIKCQSNQRAHRIHDRLGMCCDPEHWSIARGNGCYETAAECEAHFKKPCGLIKDVAVP